MNLRMFEDARLKMVAAEAVRQRWLLETEPAGNAALEDEFEAAFLEASMAMKAAIAAAPDEEEL